MKNTIITTACGKTDIGLVRKHNEDTFLIASLNANTTFEENGRTECNFAEHRALFIVSDGVGAFMGGKLASKIIANTIKEELSRAKSSIPAKDRLKLAVKKANRAVINKSKSSQKYSSMAATVTALFVEKGNAYIAEVGDSRAYILRNNRIKQLTVDQTLAQHYINETIPESGQGKNINKHVLLQAVGIDNNIQIAISSITISAEDIFILCSDGLTNRVSDTEIKNIINSSIDLQEAVNSLVALANDRGGQDNITVVLVKFTGECIKPALDGERITNKMKIISKFTFI